MLVDQGLDRPDTPASLEADRTALGCYYLSSVISCSMIKLNTLTISESVLVRAKRLASVAEHHSDGNLPHLLQYQAILDEVRDVYRTEKREASFARLHLHAQSLTTRLEVWRSNIPRDDRDTALFVARYHAAKIWIFEMGMLYHFRVGQQPSIPTTSIAVCSDISGNLVSCADAVKQYLNNFLAMSADPGSLPFEEWCRLIMAFFVLYKLSAGPCEFPKWNVQLCRSVIDLELYLTAIADKLRRAMPIHDSLVASSMSMHRVLPNILESARHSFIAIKNDSRGLQSGHRVHLDLSEARTSAALIANSNNLVGNHTVAQPTTQRARCPATAMWASQALAFDWDVDWHGIQVDGITDVSKSSTAL
ncbi:hypothetical protein LTR86_007744 [Recurvomyces mirabilis]|nr:hypothetical protein LTR86_007744 [Recurvomyces mirabilis]